MTPFALGVMVGVVGLLAASCLALTIAWVFSDHVSYTIYCGTCRASSGGCRFDWMTSVWAYYHSYKSPRCSLRHKSRPRGH